MEKKLTIAEQYDMVIEVLNGVEGTEALVEFIEDRKVKAQKKSTSKVNTAKAQENESIKATILEVLANKRMRNSDITKAVNDTMGTEYQPQKISNLVKQLKTEGSVTRIEDKGVAYFEVA